MSETRSHSGFRILGSCILLLAMENFKNWCGGFLFVSCTHACSSCLTVVYFIVPGNNSTNSLDYNHSIFWRDKFLTLWSCQLFITCFYCYNRNLEIYASLPMTDIVVLDTTYKQIPHVVPMLSSWYKWHHIFPELWWLGCDV